MTELRYEVFVSDGVRRNRTQLLPDVADRVLTAGVHVDPRRNGTRY